MASESHQAGGLPGPQRPYPKPTKTGRIPFTPPGTDLKCETSYSLWGDPATSALPPLICLHGGPGFPDRAQQYIALLNVDCGVPVILYDQIGCGDSTHLPEKRGDTAFWTIDLFIEELLNLVKSMAITTFDVLGHSWGGVVVAKLAVRQPKGLRKVIISGTPVSTATRMKATARQLSHLPPEVSATIERCIREETTKSEEYQMAVKQFLSRHLCRLNPWPPELLESMGLARQDDTVNATLFGTNPFVLTGPMKDFDIEPELPSITTQTVPGGILLLNGKYDTAQDEVMRPYFTKTRANVKWVRFGEASHHILLEDTESFLATLKDFLTLE